MTVEVLVQEYQKLSEMEKEKFFSLVLGEDELSPEWKAEISRRWQAFKEGKIKPLDGHMVEEKLAKKYGLQL